MRIERVLAPNPGPYTGPGTNTYLVGDDKGIVILDPGPLDRDHETAILEALGDRPVESVVVTHTHSDHAPLANPLAGTLGVPALGYAPGPDFDPDGVLTEGDVVVAGDVTLDVVYTPGHSDDHLCFLVGRTLFTGDHIMGGSSVMISDLGTYMDSLRKVGRLDLEKILPGHGEAIDNPVEVVSWYIAHRIERESEILAALSTGARSVTEIVEIVYAAVDPVLHELAGRSVMAHLEKLETEGRIKLIGPDSDTARVEVLR